MIDFNKVRAIGNTVVLQCRTDYAFEEIKKFILENSPHDVADGRVAMISRRRARFDRDYYVRFTFRDGSDRILDVGGHCLSFYEGREGYPILFEEDYLMHCNPIFDDFDDSICVLSLFGEVVK